MRRKKWFCSFRKWNTDQRAQQRPNQGNKQREISRYPQLLCDEFKYKGSDCCVFSSRCVLGREESHSQQFYPVSAVVCSSQTFYEGASAAPPGWRANSEGSFLHPWPVFWSPNAPLLTDELREWTADSILYLRTLLIEWREFRALKLCKNINKCINKFMQFIQRINLVDSADEKKRWQGQF